jgi:AhpD family alkylhydroperoxidase
MGKRLDVEKESAGVYKAMMALEKHVHASGLEPGLIELVKMRVSQINGCAYCLDMHGRDARKGGESEQRLFVLSAWREAPSLFTGREKAAFAWAEAVTLIHAGPVADSLYDEATRWFSPKELADLTLAVVAINGWNRLAIPFHMEPEREEAAVGAAEVVGVG